MFILTSISRDTCLRIRVVLLSLFILALVLTTCGCHAGPPDEPEDFELHNPIFTESENFIVTGIPEFNTIVSSTPTFTWVVTGQRLVYLGIFEGNIDIQNNEIVNIEDNIWAWHTGLGRGREGNIRYEDGCDVIQGELVHDAPPTPLTSGYSYVWAVWAWNDAGTEITHSSQEMFFIVE